MKLMVRRNNGNRAGSKVCYTIRLLRKSFCSLATIDRWNTLLGKTLYSHFVLCYFYATESSELIFFETYSYIVTYLYDIQLKSMRFFQVAVVQYTKFVLRFSQVLVSFLLWQHLLECEFRLFWVTKEYSSI